MAQVTYRANLSAKSFPFISQNWGRTVIVPQYDNTFSRDLSSQGDADRDIGIPQIFYCHNVMPHQQGFQSIGYTQIQPSQDFAGKSLTQTFLVRDGAGSAIYLAVDSTGGIYKQFAGSWQFLIQLANNSITIAYVSGVTYIYCANSGCYKYDFAGGGLASVTLTGLDATKVAGITYSAGYLIAWNSPKAAFTDSVTYTSGSTSASVASTTGLTVGQLVTSASLPANTVVQSIDSSTTFTLSNAAVASTTETSEFAEVASSVAWSSTIDPTDFTPSLVTGAGGGSVESARGAITCCVAHIQGFIVYTTNNAVVAVYSGNSRYPFNFREIVASGGLSVITNVTFDANTGNHYAYTTSGLQLISTTQTQTVLPELTDFISGRLFEDYDETTDTFVSQTLTASLQKQITLVSDRYLIFSYGINSLTHALVYDLTDKRWGKLKIPHVQCFEYQVPSIQIVEIPRQSIAFLQADGAIKTVDFSVTSSLSNGVIALGKYQFIRARLLQLNEIWVENVQPGFTFSILDLVALDGKNTSKVAPVLDANSTGLLRHYFTRASGINHSLVFKGAWSLNSLVLSFSVDGKR